ncbi:unnamed protein product [Rotaria sp. Silwood2]|nr:unnamed protein product [Rotaria sp. Silwood2]CAF4216144.1 unnamed protein product [Rotaria sp. Silwood2]
MFITSTTQRFSQSLELIRDSTHANGLSSGHLTNFFPSIFSFTNSENITQYVYATSSVIYVYDIYHCSCGETPLCTVPIYVDENDSLYVPGMRTGCFIIEALLQSNLICFYNQSCIETLKRIINPSIELNTTALNRSLPSRFAVDATIGSIVAELMVEEWINTTSHKAYYDRCQPITCTYLYVDKKTWLVVVTTVIGLIGGLQITLRMILPLLIDWIRSPRNVNQGKLNQNRCLQKTFYLELLTHHFL